MSIKSGTVLVTMELNGKLYFAADKRISWDYSKAATSPTKKVSKRHGILMSGTGGASLIFEIIHRCKIPKFTGGNIEKFVHDKLLPAIIGDLRYKGLVDIKERRLVSREKSNYDPSAIILIGIRHKKDIQVFEMDLNADGITVDRVPVDYSHGCGGQYAMGVLTYLKQLNFNSWDETKDKLYNPITKKKEKGFTIRKNYEILKLSAEDILEETINMASIHSPGCDSNVDIEVL